VYCYSGLCVSGERAYSSFMKAKFLYVILLVFFCSAHAQQSDDSDDDEYVIKFGLLKEKQSKFEVYEETLEIPLITSKDDADFKFGYTVEKFNDTDFNFYHVLHMPKPAEYTSNVAVEIQEHESSSTVRYEEKRVSEYGCAVTRFDEGDKPGKYQMDIYINKQLVKVIEFEVYLDKTD